MTHYTVNKHMNKTAIISWVWRNNTFLALRRLDIFYLLFYIFNLYLYYNFGNYYFVFGSLTPYFERLLIDFNTSSIIPRTI
jgi:hypothetical protein